MGTGQRTCASGRIRVKLFRHCNDVIEAYHYANILRSADIAAEVRNTLLAGAVGDIPFLEAGPQIWIHDSQDAKLAELILRQTGQPPSQPDWHCRECGECIEGQFAQCWRCGALRPFEHE